MITLKHVELKHGSSYTLKDVNATVNDGDVIAVIGPSGSGKSYLLRTILMLTPPTSGEIYLDEELIPPKGKGLDEARKKIGMVFQNFNLFENRTVIENVMIPQMDLLGRTKQEAYDRAIKSLTMIGIRDKVLKYPYELSGGQKQRAAISRTVVMEPEIILFDEPTSALDPTMTAEVQRVIRYLAESGTTIMIVTHDMKFAREIANRVFYMDEGVIYEEGTPEQIFDNPQREKTQRFTGLINVLELDITAESLDFPAAFGRIQEYCVQNRIPDKAVDRIHVVFEELCVNLLLNNYPEMKINLRIKHSAGEEKTCFLLRYDGADFNPEDSDDFISVKLFKNAADEIKYEAENYGIYTNKLEITIFDKKSEL